MRLSAPGWASLALVCCSDALPSRRRCACFVPSGHIKHKCHMAGVARQVRVKVTEVRDDGGGPPKVNCSMRAVDQETGEDLDPGGALVRGGGRPGGGGGGPRGPVSDAPPEVCPQGVELGSSQGSSGVSLHFIGLRDAMWAMVMVIVRPMGPHAAA